MKVVILAGGLGTRMREETEFRPKPMVEIGGKPVLWHIMRNFSFFGFNDFVVLAGYRQDVVKDYFLNFMAKNYDFTLELSRPGQVEFHHRGQPESWRVTVLDTGLETPTGGRLVVAREHLKGEPFFCTYGDGIANVDIRQLLSKHRDASKLATLTRTMAAGRFGVLDVNQSGEVTSFKEKPDSGDPINIGFFVFESRIFDYLSESRALEDGPLQQLARDGELASYEHRGFWQPMDTYREYLALNKLWNGGNPPWLMEADQR